MTVILASTSAFMSAENRAERQAEQDIRTAIGAYIRGAATVNPADFEQAFAIPGASLKSVWHNSDTGLDQLGERPIAEAIVSWTRGEPQESWGKIVSIDIIDEQLATVKLELLFNGTEYLDVMTLFPINGEWKIVNKVWVNRGRIGDG